MDQKKTIRPFSMKDKIGYTLGDLGCCFTEQYRAMYLSIFYTLILQVNPFHVGILLLITKIWDAVNDPIIGAMVDSRKATKGGKFIPWIRAFSFPMAVLCILGFVNVGNINYGLRLAFIVINGICYLGASGMQVLIWAMVNDAIDYHELQTGERNEGIVYSTYSFFRKLASAISGSLSSFVLGAIGYNVTAGAVQTAGVVNAIWKSYTGIYFLGYGIAVAILFFVYPLTKQKTAEMLTELKARRAAKESK